MTLSATTLSSSPSITDCVEFFFFICNLGRVWKRRREGERVKGRSLCSGPAWAASKEPNQVSIDTMAELSRTTALKSSEFHKYGKQNLCVSTTGERRQQPVGLQPRVWCIFASARCLITAQTPLQKASLRGDEGKPCCMCLLIFSHQRGIRFPPRQHNLQWEMSSCTEHDLRFHLLLKCLGCWRILAELAGVDFLWTHCNVGGYVSVITSWAKACAVYSLEYPFFFFFMNTFGRHLWNLKRSERREMWVWWKVRNSSWKFSIM